MNFEFSDDQKLIQEQARQFLAEHSPLTATRKVMDGESVSVSYTHLTLPTSDLV